MPPSVEPSAVILEPWPNNSGTQSRKSLTEWRIPYYRACTINGVIPLYVVGHGLVDIVVFTEPEDNHGELRKMKPMAAREVFEPLRALHAYVCIYNAKKQVRSRTIKYYLTRCHAVGAGL